MKPERLKERRKVQKLTQEDLANKLGVARTTVVGWERGDRTPETDMLPKITKTLHCTSDYLLGLSDNPMLTEYENKAVSLDEIKLFRNKLANGEFGDIPVSRVPHLIDALDKEIMMIEKELQELKAQK